jgi:chromosome segregation ATPase
VGKVSIDINITRSDLQETRRQMREVASQIDRAERELETLRERYRKLDKEEDSLMGYVSAIEHGAYD